LPRANGESFPGTHADNLPMVESQNMEWRFLNTGHRSGAFNMEFDKSLVTSLANGAGAPAIRVYGWKPAAISLGWNQRIEEIDTERAHEAGVDVVRRPTGGRAILHSEELTYSVTLVSSARNILPVYNEISLALVQGLRDLGVAVSLEKAQPHFPTLYRSASSALCFSSSARYEIQVGGRKLVGSAQRRFIGKDGAEVVLQHGSILLGSDHKRLVDFLRLNGESDRAQLRNDIDQKTIDLSDALGRRITYDEAVEAVRSGFEKAWGIHLRMDTPEPADMGVMP
jgi:lipoate-protein ligase A